ncbi:hypothetical protein [Sorangium sp. So ce1389]
MRRQRWPATQEDHLVVPLSHLLLFEDEGSGLDRSAYFSAVEDDERPD